MHQERIRNISSYSVKKRIIITLLAAIVFFFAYIYISMLFLYGSVAYITKIDADGAELLADNVEVLGLMPESRVISSAQYMGGLYHGSGGLAGSYIDIFVTLPAADIDDNELNVPSNAKVLRKNNDYVYMMLHITLTEEHDEVHAWARKNVDYKASDVSKTWLAIAPVVILIVIWFPYHKIKQNRKAR